MTPPADLERLAQAARHWDSDIEAWQPGGDVTVWSGDLADLLARLRAAEGRVGYIEGLLGRVMACWPEGSTAALLHWDDLQAIRAALHEGQDAG